MAPIALVREKLPDRRRRRVAGIDEAVPARECDSGAELLIHAVFLRCAGGKEDVTIHRADGGAGGENECPNDRIHDPSCSRTHHRRRVVHGHNERCRTASESIRETRRDAAMRRFK